MRGRLFTRNPTTGARRPALEGTPLLSLQQQHPAEVSRLLEEAGRLEAEQSQALAVDFRIESTGLQISGWEPLVGSPQATVKIAVDLAEEGRISCEEAVRRVPPAALTQLLTPSFEAAEMRQAVRQGRLLARGQEGSGGAVCGRVALDAAAGWRLHAEGHAVLLVVDRLTYRERELLEVVSGVVVRDGSLLAARRYERPCLVCPDLRPAEGEKLALDATGGQVFQGSLSLDPGGLTGEAVRLLDWADRYRRLDVRANLGSVWELPQAQALGAQGVGLCRIESLFHQDGPAFQRALQAVCADETPDRGPLTAALRELFQAAPPDWPFVVRLLDAPLSMMLRHWEEQTPLPPDFFAGPLGPLRFELNPMHGLRCGRLALLRPALLDMQLLALKEAASGLPVRLQVMLPGTCDAHELRLLRAAVERVWEEGERPPLGSMLEIPRACLTADLVAEEAQFLSFGTGDLTEATCGLSRYDGPLSFLPEYLAQGVFARDPFETIDRDGVGELMRIAVEKVGGRCEVGTCGAQAVDAESVDLCHQLGLSYVSVPAGHLPAVRLAAAQAALRGQT